MKGRLSKKWGEAQHIYYQMNPDTKREKYFNQKAWMKASIQAFIDMSLGIWDGRCKVLHGRTVEEQREKSGRGYWERLGVVSINRRWCSSRMGTYSMGVGVFGKAGDIVFGEVGGILRGGCFSEGPVGETAGETGGNRGSD